MQKLETKSNKEDHTRMTEYPSLSWNSIKVSYDVSTHSLLIRCKLMLYLEKIFHSYPLSENEIFLSSQYLFWNISLQTRTIFRRHDILWSCSRRAKSSQNCSERSGNLCDVGEGFLDCTVWLQYNLIEINLMFQCLAHICMMSQRIRMIHEPSFWLKILGGLLGRWKGIFFINLASRSLSRSVDGDSTRGVEIMSFECCLLSIFECFSLFGVRSCGCLSWGLKLFIRTTFNKFGSITWDFPLYPLSSFSFPISSSFHLCNSHNSFINSSFLSLMMKTALNFSLFGSGF